MSEKIPIPLQQTFDNIIRWCARNKKNEFVGDDVAAPKGHLRALANRGKVIRVGKVKGRGSCAPIIWKIINI
jgi:hypothetical protein